MSRRDAAAPVPHAPLKRWVNDVIHETFGARSKSTQLAFFCECREPNCFATVWLTPLEFSLSRSDPAADVLSSGHVAERRVPAPAAAPQAAEQAGPSAS